MAQMTERMKMPLPSDTNPSTAGFDKGIHTLPQRPQTPKAGQEEARPGPSAATLGPLAGRRGGTAVDPSLASGGGLGLKPCSGRLKDPAADDGRVDQTNHSRGLRQRPPPSNQKNASIRPLFCKVAGPTTHCATGR